MPMAISTGKYAMKSIIDCLGRPLSEAYIETSSNSTQTVITSAQSTFFQPSIGSQTGSAAVTPTSASFSAVGSGGAAPSGSASGSAGGSTPSGAAGRAAGVAGVVPVALSLVAVAAGMAFIA